MYIYNVLTLFTRRSSESSSANAVAIDTLAVAVTVSNFTLIMLQLALQTFPAYKKMITKILIG